MSIWPDIVILMTDEERAVPPYEAHEVLAWRDRTLAGREWFDEHGVSFQRHYTGSLACVPSRPTSSPGTTPTARRHPDRRHRQGVRRFPHAWLRVGECRPSPLVPGRWLRHPLRGQVAHQPATSPTRPPATRWRPTTTTASSTVPQCSAISTRIRLRRSGFRAGSGPSRTVRCWPTRGFGGTRLIADRVVAWLEDRYARRRAEIADALPAIPVGGQLRQPARHRVVPGVAAAQPRSTGAAGPTACATGADGGRGPVDQARRADRVPAAFYSGTAWRP